MRRRFFVLFSSARLMGEQQPDIPLAWFESSFLSNPAAMKAQCADKRQQPSSRRT